MSDLYPTERSDDPAEPRIRAYADAVSFSAPSNPLGLLALVNTTESGHKALRRQEIHPPESRDIAVLCTRIQSVAEIGARLNLSLAVVQVLVGDLQRASLVRVLAPQYPERPSADLLARVLQGLCGPN